MYAKAGKEFSNLLLSFLTFPLKAILINCFRGFTGMASVDNLYRSILDLNCKNCMKPIHSNTFLLEFLKDLHAEIAISFDTSKNGQIKKCSQGLRWMLFNFMNSKYSDVEECRRELLKGSTTFMVTDELVVKPFSIISVIALHSTT